MNRRTLHRTAPLVALALVAACQDSAPPAAPEVTADDPLLARSATRGQLLPTGKNVGTLTSTLDRTRFRLRYHDNGPVMVATPHVYLIWYGDWTGNDARQVVANFLTSVGGSAYFAINTQYHDVSGAAPSGGLIFAGDSDDSYSHGRDLSDADVQAVVAASIVNHRLPLDPRGIYFVLGSADVDATSGLCSLYCGFHNWTTIIGTTVRYGFVGDGARCPGQCAPQVVSPSGNFGADAMISTLATLISGTISDPTLSSWYDRLGLEGAEKCAWSYGATYSTANGAQANIVLGGRDYLVPQNWVMTKRGGHCALSLTDPPPRGKVAARGGRRSR